MGATWAKSIPSSHGVTLKTLFGLDMGGTWARFMSTMCDNVVWARYGRNWPFESSECPLSRLICVFPLFGLDMGATWGKSMPSSHGVTLKPKFRGLPFEPWSVPSRAFYMCYPIVWARYGRDLGKINPLTPTRWEPMGSH